MAEEKKQDPKEAKQEIKMEDLAVEESKQEEVKGGVPHLLRIIE